MITPALVSLPSNQSGGILCFVVELTIQMEDWEALDLDDSDLPSLFRPCKRRCRRRHHHHSNSQHSHQFSNSSLSLQQQPTSPSQTLRSPQSLQLPNPNSTSPPFIPGPAGPVQAAMILKGRAHQNLTCATQEYIRRAVEDGEVDEDLHLNPWLCALLFLGRPTKLLFLSHFYRFTIF